MTFSKRLPGSVNLPAAITPHDRSMNQAITDMYRNLQRWFDGGITITDGDFQINRAEAGGEVSLNVQNTSNTANSYATIYVQTGGASAADPNIQFHTHDLSAWAIGVDNSDSDSFVVSAGGSIGTNNVLKALTGGDVSIPLGSLIGGIVSGGQWAIKSFTESLSTTATPTDTVANLLPADSIILGVTVRVTTAVAGTLATFTVGDATTAARFAAAVPKAVSTTAVGVLQFNGTNAANQAAAAKVRIASTSGTITSGVVRIVVYALVFTPPTS